MSYFYFSHKNIFKVALDENEKSQLLPFLNASKAIEKIVTDEQFERFELNKFTYYLDDSDNLIEIENKNSMTLEESFNTRASVIGSDTLSEIALRNAINQYIFTIDLYLQNNNSEKWSSFNTRSFFFILLLSTHS